jgi:hypothetical protein
MEVSAKGYRNRTVGFAVAEKVLKTKCLFLGKNKKLLYYENIFIDPNASAYRELQKGIYML